MLYESGEVVIKLFDDYPLIASVAKCKVKYGEGLEILTPKQMLQRLPIVRAQVNAGNTSENLSYILCIEQKKLLKKYTTI